MYCSQCLSSCLQNERMDILQTKSCDNLGDLFTKSLPTSLGMKQLKDLQKSRGGTPLI
jgi:hypothetical protein